VSEKEAKEADHVHIEEEDHLTLSLEALKFFSYLVAFEHVIILF
jgi:hypothetical protein